jgi:hypothetical protein
VDRVFSQAVLNGVYSFHASASSYADFWNHSYSHGITLTRSQIWQAFVQESIRTISSSSNNDLTLRDNLGINDVTSEAYAILGENGVIRSANHHSCSECTHDYRDTADMIPDAGNDPAALVGIDEQRIVPELHGPDADLAVRDAAAARRRAANPPAEEDVEMPEALPVRMVVLDGIVMGHQVCQMLPRFKINN